MTIAADSIKRWCHGILLQTSETVRPTRIRWTVTKLLFRVSLRLGGAQ